MTDYANVGYRYVDAIDFPEPPAVGQSLDNSYDWDSDTELRGACAFETREMIDDYTKHCDDGWILVIGGNGYCGWGELAGEMVICDAVVISVEAINR